MQVLSCSSAGVLVAMCGLLLRSQTLISGARSPNFETSDPNIESSDISTELVPVIVLLIFLLAAPAIVAISLASKSKFRRLYARFHVSLLRTWQKWRQRKISPMTNISASEIAQAKAATVLVAAAKYYNRKRKLAVSAGDALGAS